MLNCVRYGKIEERFYRNACIIIFGLYYIVFDSINKCEINSQYKTHFFRKVHNVLTLSCSLNNFVNPVLLKQNVKCV